MSIPRPLVGRPVAVAVASLLLGGLSGCGVAGTGLQPGVAARVGDETISTREVDSIAGDYCSSIEKQLSEGNQVLPRRYLRGGVAGQLALVAAARQLADEQGVDVGPQYTRKVSDLEDAVAGLPEDQARAVVEVESSGTYLAEVRTAVGKKLLAEQGTGDAGTAEAEAAGQKALAAWLDDHDVELDPKLGVRIEDGQAVPADESLSHGVSDVATMGRAESPDQEYAAALPDSHRCG